MPLCKVNHMDVITNSGTVRCVVIISVDMELFQLADCNLRNIRHQIVRYAIGILTHGAGFVRADRIKIAQKNHIPRRIRKLNIPQNLLQHRFGPAIRIGALSLRALLRNRYKGRISVNRSR